MDCLFELNTFQLLIAENEVVLTGQGAKFSIFLCLNDCLQFFGGVEG